MAKITLGKGLSALIPEEIDIQDKRQFALLETARIIASPDQPRRQFDEQGLTDLADSIRQNGMLQPLLVKAKNGGYELVAGERRLRAALMIGLEKVPAVLIDGISRQEQMQLALIENLQREDLNMMELAEGYARLINEYALTQEDLAQRVSKDRSTIANTLRLLNLPEEIQQQIRSGKISPGHARALLALESREEQLQVARLIVSENLSVRTLEELIYGKKRKKRGRSLKLKKLPPDFADAENRLKQHLGTRVLLRRGLKRGRIEIEFYSEADLNRILEIILSR